MGHVRLGRLPKTRKWLQVVNLLDTAPQATPKVAGAVLQAADPRLRALGSDPCLGLCFWLLVRITWAARKEDFVEVVESLDIPVSDETSTVGFIARLSDKVQREVARHPESGPFGEFASLALRRTLTETIAETPPDLFDSSTEHLRRVCKVYSTRRHFGVLCRRFFGDFLARTLRYFVSRELSNHIGQGCELQDMHDGAEFLVSLDLYARESAHIMEEFASGWYSKHNWESKGEISRDEAQRFVAVALRKFRMELQREWS